MIFLNNLFACTVLVALLFSQRGTSATAEQTVTAMNPIIEFDPDDFMEQGFNFNHALILVCNKSPQCLQANLELSQLAQEYPQVTFGRTTINNDNEPDEDGFVAINPTYVIFQGGIYAHARKRFPGKKPISILRGVLSASLSRARALRVFESWDVIVDELYRNTVFLGIFRQRDLKQYEEFDAIAAQSIFDDITYGKIMIPNNSSISMFLKQIHLPYDILENIEEPPCYLLLYKTNQNYFERVKKRPAKNYHGAFVATEIADWIQTYQFNALSPLTAGTLWRAATAHQPLAVVVPALDDHTHGRTFLDVVAAGVYDNFVQKIVFGWTSDKELIHDVFGITVEKEPFVIVMDPFSNKIYAKHLDVKIGFFAIDWVTDILSKKIKEKPLIKSENIVNQKTNSRTQTITRKTILKFINESGKKYVLYVLSDCASCDSVRTVIEGIAQSCENARFGVFNLSRNDLPRKVPLPNVRTYPLPLLVDYTAATRPVALDIPLMEQFISQFVNCPTQSQEQKEEQKEEHQHHQQQQQLKKEL